MAMKGDRIRIRNAEELRTRSYEEKDQQLKVRLVFLNAIANHSMNFEDTCNMCGISTPTGYLWIRNWNREGYEGIKDKENKGGRPPKLSDEDMEKLRDRLQTKEYWTTKEAKDEIKKEFGVEYSDDQVVRILRHKLNMRFSKPFPKDYRKPGDAEDILETELRLVFSLLKEKGIKDDEIAIGFIDEARPQNTPNTVKVWSFDKVRSIKNTTRFKTNTIGFYAIKGQSSRMFLEDSTAASIANFLDDIKEVNSEYKAIVAILDRFASHRSALVKEKAEELGIYLVYLPAYSPDLNPIEYIWKSIKRTLSIVFAIDLEDMREIITEEWNKFSSYLSYAKGWINKFLIRKDYYIW